MVDEIKYRQVQETDANSVFLVDKIRYEEIHEEPLSLSYIKDCIKLYQATFFVALVNEGIVGFCIGLTSKTTNLCLISAVTVSSNYKGHSIGKHLVKRVCEEFERVGYDSVSLTAKPPKLTEYYMNLGFVKVTGELENYYGEGEHRFILRKTF